MDFERYHSFEKCEACGRVTTCAECPCADGGSERMLATDLRAPGCTSRRIWSNLTALTMPVCPKCGKLISAKKYERHLKRCGSQHKHRTSQLKGSNDFLMKI